MADEDYEMRDQASTDNIAFNAMQSGTTNMNVESLEDEGTPKDFTMLHAALAGAGMAPGVGFIADLADAALYGIEGDIAGTGLSLISAIPILGLVSGSGRLAKAGARAAKVDPRVPQQLKDPRFPQELSKKAFDGFKKLEEQINFNRGQGLSTGTGGADAAKELQQYGEKIRKSLTGMEMELSRVSKLAGRSGFDEDQVMDIMAYIKGQDALPAMLRSGNIGGSTLLEMQAGIARGARFFTSLDSAQQNMFLRASEAEIDVDEMGERSSAEQAQQSSMDRLPQSEDTF